jgi:phosphatidylserine decarboxylase
MIKIGIMISSEGRKQILLSTLILFISAGLMCLFPLLIFRIITLLSSIIFIFNFYFFRDPDRNIPADENVIVSPGDGTVVQIIEIQEPYYFKKKVKRISIFLSIFNVHVNRIPVSGEVEFIKYIPGKFFPAFMSKASLNNEQSVIGISNRNNKILVKQIAGIIAQRVMFHLKVGDHVKKGDRFGIIKYGSRVDVFLDERVELKIKLHDKVTGGETVIGIMQSS